MHDFLPSVQYHLGSIYHIQGHYIAAKDTYEGILAKKNVANSIKAMALRQLGKCSCSFSHEGKKEQYTNFV